LNLWRALEAGRWSLSDVFDSDGRRYIVARPNEPEVPRDGILSERERQVAEQVSCGRSNKLIAYELGLDPSTVSTHLTTACRKLGVDSRAALIRAFRTRRLNGDGKEDSST
jgi:DNA-binding NarL/FixJ family response regulator